MKQVLLPKIILLGFILSLSSPGLAGGQLATSIKEARHRADNERQKLSNKAINETNQQMDSWTERTQETIEIQHTGMSGHGGVDLGDPDFSMEDLGEDHSGLDSLRSRVEEESTDIDFDEELREVSSIKN